MSGSMSEAEIERVRQADPPPGSVEITRVDHVRPGVVHIWYAPVPAVAAQP